MTAPEPVVVELRHGLHAVLILKPKPTPRTAPVSNPAASAPWMQQELDHEGSA